MTTTAAERREQLIAIHKAAVDAVAPGPSLTAALARDQAGVGRRVWIIAIGKAAHPMAEAAVESMKKRGARPAGGIIIAPSPAIPPHPSLNLAVGNHPVPGAGSLAAATRLGDVVSRVRGEDEVWVLLSGGATSLAAAPVGDVRQEELAELFQLLLGSGLDIVAMNLVRKRFLRWAAGRLAAALHPAHIRNYIISDVIGDNLAMIGSGPCVPDDSTAADVRAQLTTAGLWEKIAPSLRAVVERAEADPALETPKPGNEVFFTVDKRVIASNRVALEAAAARAAALGLEPRVMNAAVSGEAAAVGRKIAQILVHYHAAPSPAVRATGRTPIYVASITPRVSTRVAPVAGVSAPAHPTGTCFIWGGETTVTLPEGSTGRGGRCQELALAAASQLAVAGPLAQGITLLAAGTDGADGPTDADGAIVDATTWQAITRAGHDPAGELAAHDSYAALDAAGALYRTGLTGTNVMDVVVGLCQTIPRPRT